MPVRADKSQPFFGRFAEKTLAFGPQLDYISSDPISQKSPVGERIRLLRTYIALPIPVGTHVAFQYAFEFMEIENRCW